MEQRRIADRRLERIEDRLARLEARINMLFGATALLIVLANAVIPIVIKAIAP